MEEKIIGRKVIMEESSYEEAYRGRGREIC